MTAIATEKEKLTALPVGTWNVDPVHSQVGFAVDYMIGTFHGSFAPVEAVLDVDSDGQARLVGKAPVAGVRVQDESLEAHLLSPEFFDAQRTPELGFTSESVQVADGQVTIKGQLEIRGATQPVSLTGSFGEVKLDPWGQERFRLTLQGSIDRTAFGIVWNNPLPSGEPALADEVRIEAELYLVKAGGGQEG